MEKIMRRTLVQSFAVTLGALALVPGAALGAEPVFSWQTVVNNGVTVPGDTRTFNSYNQPSINVNRMVVFRARSKGGTTGEPAHGVFTRDMGLGTGLVTIFDRNTLVPQPNNTGKKFIEPPSFPRIDMYSNTMASRGNHEPVWEYQLSDLTETRAGTTGIYTNPFGSLITGASNLGIVPAFSFFAVPGVTPQTKFDVFPGAPAVTGGNTIVFKGNYTVPASTPGVYISKTGVYFRTLTNNPIPLASGNLSPAAGTNPVVLIANSDTRMPGEKVNFGSTAPPSAAAGLAVFAGFDNEENPTAGGIYIANLAAKPNVANVVKIGGPVPGESGQKFNRIGEGLSFDGRFIAFWGAWGTETKTLILQCPEEGNAGRQAYCVEHHPDGFTTTVPVHQGIFVYDTSDQNTYAVAKTGSDYDDFVYWNFSGLVPGTGESDETGEPARWRSASFVAVSGLVDGRLTDAGFHVAFKARKGTVVNGAYSNAIDGIYVKAYASGKLSAAVTAVKTGMDGILIDPAAIYIDDFGQQTILPVTEMGLERDGFRGKYLAINVSMGTEEAGWAGIYLTQVPAVLQ
ncbi:MAG: hypothetical protein JST11_13400 [Acidobacteria bacterium]|nr:hypothetical protein [Acidobacteriota bacterium]